MPENGVGAEPRVPAEMVAGGMLTMEIPPLAALGVTPEFFHLPPTVTGFVTLDYYLVGVQNPSAIARNPLQLLLDSYWDILAVATLPHERNGLVLRQIHIEEEEQEMPEFNAWSDGQGSFALNPPQVAALRAFLLDLAKQLPDTARDREPHSYFTPATADAYTDCGIPSALVDRFRPLLERDPRLYHYHPDPTITPIGACRFLVVSDWTAPWRTHPLSATLSFGFETYTPDRIVAIQEAYAHFVRDQATTPYMPADIMWGERTLYLSQGALRAVATLLGERLNALAQGGGPDMFPSSVR